MYAPIAALLREMKLSLILRETIPDPNMMFGRGELEVYRPSGGHYPDVPIQAPGYLKKLVVGGQFE